MKKRLKIILYVIILTAAVGLVAYGVVNGGFKDVKGKAVRICNECIGIG